jgi:hypothetical protein
MKISRPIFRFAPVSLAVLLVVSVATFGLAGGEDLVFHKILRLERVSEVFDGGSVRFDFQTDNGVLKIGLFDQTFLHEHELENPDAQRVCVYSDGKPVFIEQKSPEEKAFRSILTRFAQSTELDSSTRIKVDHLIEISKDRKTPAVTRDVWYQ